MKTLLATLLVTILGVSALWMGTDGGQAFTAEEARRLEIRTTPRQVPEWVLENQDGDTFRIQDWHEKFIVVDFIYTSCLTVCLSLSSDMRKLQQTFAPLVQANKLRFLSISFDPEKDTPQRLKEHLSHFSADFNSWTAARSTSAAQNKTILDFFKVTVIPDEYGGYIHSAGYHIIAPSGKLIAIFGAEQITELHSYLQQLQNDTINPSPSQQHPLTTHRTSPVGHAATAALTGTEHDYAYAGSDSAAGHHRLVHWAQFA